MHDLHIHTSLSRCAGKNSEPESYFAEISGRKFSVAGFTNHLWDSAVPGASDWYRPQNVDHVLSLREKIRGTKIPGTRLLLGCETEYIGNKAVGLTSEHAALFDYVLIPPHHFHMKGFVIPEDTTETAEIQKLLIERFIEVCEIDFAFGIAHPFAPLGHWERTVELLSGISDAAFVECFRTAAEKRKSIEINLSTLNKFSNLGLLAEYERIMTIARQCGCFFHIGSDAHGIAGFDEKFFRAGMDFAKKCDITLPDAPIAENLRP